MEKETMITTAHIRASKRLEIIDTDIKLAKESIDNSVSTLSLYNLIKTNYDNSTSYLMITDIKKIYDYLNLLCEKDFTMEEKRDIETDKQDNYNVICEKDTYKFIGIAK